MQNYVLKEKTYLFCKRFIEGRLARIHNSISSIQESLSSETKSSAGDKHETGRAMLQLEREKLGTQLADAEATKQLLSKVNIDANQKQNYGIPGSKNYKNRGLKAKTARTTEAKHEKCRKNLLKGIFLLWIIENRLTPESA